MKIVEQNQLNRRRKKEIQEKKKREEFVKFWGNVLTTNEKSRAHSIFCERVFGQDLGQYGMMDMVQLEKLLDVLALSAKNKVIDLGCATGKISEYISNTTGAHVLGIDLMRGAIHSALERTRKKRDRLDFQEGDIHNLSLDPACVDTIIAIDSIHYRGISLEQLIIQLMELLTRGGQMGIFYSEHCDFRKIKLDQVLKNLNLSFQIWDFTDSEHEIWLKQAQILEELKEDFIAEGNLRGYKVRKTDCDTFLRIFKEGKGRRNLYHVQLA